MILRKLRFDQPTMVQPIETKTIPGLISVTPKTHSEVLFCLINNTVNISLVFVKILLVFGLTFAKVHISLLSAVTIVEK